MWPMVYNKTIEMFSYTNVWSKQRFKSGPFKKTFEEFQFKYGVEREC